MKKYKLFGLASVLLLVPFLLSGCSSTSQDLTSSREESAPVASATGDSLPKIDTTAIAESPSTITFPVTTLKLKEGTILLLKVLGTNGKIVAKSELLNYTPSSASVTSQGDAFIDFSFPAGTTTELAQNNKLVKVLYEVYPDSKGRQVETEIARY